jgi:hypothetical protein
LEVQRDGKNEFELVLKKLHFRRSQASVDEIGLGMKAAWALVV